MEVMLLAKQVIEARKADRIEIETCLEQFDVERFRCPDVLFNSKWQRCVKHVPTPKEKNGQISERLLPGYRRNGVLIRPECVNVFVKKNNKGEIK